MPIYEYQCEGCAYRFEVKQSIKDDPLTTCERCGQAVRRLISSPGILFKGSGWYVTDYSDKLKPPSSTGGDTGGTATGEKKDTATPAAASSTPSAPAAAPATASTSSSTAASNTATSSSSS
ncbi:MAG: transcriptional regulator [Nitrospira sp.]|nr:transcriptional regulator [Nitrospira sp.]MBX3334233.1 transcriptional regulator [Nitrospira sp.]